MLEGKKQLEKLIGSEASAPVSLAAETAARAIQAKHNGPIVAIIFYGSCLREESDDGKVLDFYVIADSYRSFHPNKLLAVLNALVPPNVYYFEVPFDGRKIRAKYAVISLRAFERRSQPGALLPSIWCRFSQPVRLLYARDAVDRERVLSALTACVLTTMKSVSPLMSERFDGEGLWTRVFAESYATELRAERAQHPQKLYALAASTYIELTATAVRLGLLPNCTPAPDRLGMVDHKSTAGDRIRVAFIWALRRLVGKVLSVLRLLKGAFTFTNGLDYLLWKIERHSGVHLEPTGWQRRHPVLASPKLAWHLYRCGAFR